MTVVADAPVRVDFAGGWSDVPDFADRGGGRVVNAAIALRTRVECRLGGGRIRLIAEDLGQRLSLHAPADLIYDGTLDLHKAALNMLPVGGGIEIITSSDVPPGSGLGASGSLDVSLLAALARCREQEACSAEDLAEMGYCLEAEELQLRGGRQDQFAAALGGFNDLGFREGRVQVSPLTVPDEAARDLRRHLVIAYTGQSHFSSATHARVWEAFHAGNATVGTAIARMRDLAGECAAAIGAGDWRSLAAAVDANWACQQRLDPTIATEGTRLMETAARAAGAWGVKATGAGAGGCLLILGPPNATDAVAAAVTDAGARVLDWEFDPIGVTVREE